MHSAEQWNHRILVVDDEPEIRAILLRHLSGDAQCSSAHSAFDALNKIKHGHFDLVITDIMMPGMTGIELLRCIKRRDPETAVIMATGLMDVNAAVHALRMGATDFVTKPFDLNAITRAVNRALELRRLVIENRRYREELETRVKQRTQELNGALNEIKESYKMTLEALVSALDAREHETHAHSRRVREYTLTLAKQMGLPGEELIHIGRGALLHDVGKIGVPDSILLKPEKLTPGEWAVMREHPRIGYDILRGISFLAPAADIVLAHQERWDGQGYPKGLAGTEIPLGARIFAVVDTMDAMTSNRPYRKALSFEATAQEMRRCAGTQFDPSVVSAFLTIPVDLWKSIHTVVSEAPQVQDSSDLLCWA
jgi:putative two-component system response regulator